MEFSERRDEALHFLQALWGGTGRTADLGLFVLPGATALRVPTSDLTVAAHEAVQASLQPDANVYMSCCLLSPESAARGGRGRAEDTVAMSALWADLDISGPAHKSTSLPPDRDAGLALLAAMTHVPSLVVDSGWGLQAWWLFEHPMALDTEESRHQFHRLVRGCQTALGQLAGQQGWTVDPTADLARVLRLPGTTNWKIDGDPRPVRVIFESDLRYPPLQLAGAWADLVPETDRGPAPPLPERITAGGRTHSVTSLAGSLRRRNVVEAAALAAALEHNRLVCDPPLSEDKVRETVAGIYRRYDPPLTGTGTVNGHRNGHSSAQFVSMSTVEPVAMRYIWEPGVIQGGMTLLAGDPGKGKGLVATALAAAMTTGRGLPGCAPTPGSVLWVSYEESEATAIRPRLDVAGADVERVFKLVIDRGDGKRAGRIFKPEDLELLEAELVRYPDVRLMILDPVLSFMRRGANINQGNDVRDSLDPLVELAETYGIGLLGIAHINKSELSKVLYRVSNSVAFTALARSVLAVGDLEDGRRVLAHIKANYSMPFTPVPFRINGAAHPTLGNSVGQVVWEEPDPEIDVARIFEDHRVDKGKPGPMKAEACAEALKGLLAVGPQWVGIAKAKLAKAGFGRASIEDGLAMAGVITIGRGRSARWSLEEALDLPPTVCSNSEATNCDVDLTESDHRVTTHTAGDSRDVVFPPALGNHAGQRSATDSGPEEEGDA